MDFFLSLLEGVFKPREERKEGFAIAFAHKSCCFNKPSHQKSTGEGSGEGVDDTLLSDTLRYFSLTDFTSEPG